MYNLTIYFPILLYAFQTLNSSEWTDKYTARSQELRSRN